MEFEGKPNIKNACGIIEYIGIHKEKLNQIEYSSINMKSDSGKSITLGKVYVPKDFLHFIEIGKKLSLNYFEYPNKIKYLIFVTDGNQKIYNASSVSSFAKFFLILFILFLITTICSVLFSFHRPFIGIPISLILIFFSIFLYTMFISHTAILIESKKQFDQI